MIRQLHERGKEGREVEDRDQQSSPNEIPYAQLDMGEIGHGLQSLKRLIEESEYCVTDDRPVS